MSFVMCGDNDDDWIVTFYTEDMIVQQITNCVYIDVPILY